MCATRKELQDFDSLYELLDYFATEEICEEYLAGIRWNGKPVCPYCNGGNVNKLGGKTKRYKCYNKECQKQFSVKVGTIFHDTKLPLRKWFMAIYLVAAHKKGISSHQLGRDLKISQEAAWFLLQRVRQAYIPRKAKFAKKTVEIDETYWGPKEANLHRDKKTPNNQGRSNKTKSPILGILERDGKVYAVPVKDTSGKTVLPIVDAFVKKGSKIYTDEYRPYRKLKERFRHIYVNHGAKQYVRGEAHTNGIENFWSHLKRGIHGTYHHVSKKHLERYVNEFTFRYNNREIKDSSIFNTCLQSLERRIDYKTLTRGKRD